MTERQVLRDPIYVRGADERRPAQRPAAFGAFALTLVAPARAPEQDLAGAGYFETFACRFFGFNAFGSSHSRSFSSCGQASLAVRVQVPIALPLRA